MSAAWASAGNARAQITVPGADHFSILNEFCREDGILRGAIREFDPMRATANGGEGGIRTHVTFP